MTSTASLISACAAVLVSACAAHTPTPLGGPATPTHKAIAEITADVQPQAGDGFLLSLPGVPGGPQGAQLKSEALKQADAYCASLNKGLSVDEAMPTSTQPPGYAVRFSCAAKPAPE